MKNGDEKYILTLTREQAQVAQNALEALRPVENRAVRPHHGADAGRAERG